MKTTKKEYDAYRGFVKDWIKKLGLLNWEFHFELGKTDKGMISEAHWIYANKMAIIVFNEEHDMILDDDVLNKIAFHEVCHILLAGYQYLIENNLSKKEHIDPIDHDIIRTFENLYFNVD